MQFEVDASCATCDRLVIKRGLPTCKAFPKGIPDEILDGQHDHSEPFPGDGGILFKQRDEVARLG